MESERKRMKIFTSYFYQIRFFRPYMIPLSTAVGDPLWYHRDSKDKSVVFVDRRGVINGLRILPLVPDSTCSNLCHGRDNCSEPDPTSCSFLQNYYKQLEKINFDEFMENLSSHIGTICARRSINVEPFVVIIVHESIYNQCSERVMIQKWFADNGITVTELNPTYY